MKFHILIVPFLAFIISCGSDQDLQNSPEETSKITEVRETEQEEPSSGFENGRHSATVYYSNSETGYSTTYTLDVEVEDNEVTTIYFENGGYLDSDHISPAELDEDGTTMVYGEEGKTYDIQIDY